MVITVYFSFIISMISLKFVFSFFVSTSELCCEYLLNFVYYLSYTLLPCLKACHIYFDAFVSTIHLPIWHIQIPFMVSHVTSHYLIDYCIYVFLNNVLSFMYLLLV